MCEIRRFKFCPSCDLDQPVEVFPVLHRYTAKGERVEYLGTYCRGCVNAQNRARRAEYRRRYEERQAWLAEPPF